MTCKVGALLDGGLSTEDTDTLTAALEGDSRWGQVSADALARALTAEGHDVGPTTVKDHRAGRCACNRKASA